MGTLIDEKNKASIQWRTPLIVNKNIGYEAAANNF